MEQIKKPELIPSPASTGGAGVFFEQHVGAAFLSLLLVRGISPCLPGCQLTEVHFQTKQKGWRTDDLLLVGKEASGQKRHLAAQIKRRIVVSRKDDDFRDAISNAWEDFKAGKPFNANTDKFAIITLRGSESLLNHFVGLLDCARSSKDAADLAGRLATPGFLDKTASKYYQEVRAVIEEASGQGQDASAIFSFLIRLHLWSFDLNSATAQTEAWIKTLLAYTAIGPDSVGASNTTWNELLALVGAGEPHSAGYTYADLPHTARERHGAVHHKDFQALETLKQHSSPIRQGTVTTIGGKLHLARTTLADQVTDALHNSRVVVITGAAGSGKSGIAAEVFDNINRESPAFAFRAEEFARAHLDETLNSAQVQINAQQLSALLALESRKLFWVESLERLLEKTERTAFADLLQIIRDDPSCKLLLTCRDYSVDLVRSSFLEQAGLRHEVVIAPTLSDEELKQVFEAFPQLKPLTLSPSIYQLLRNPYILDKAARMQWPDGTPFPENERNFRAKVWQEIIRENRFPAESMPHRRGRTFIDVALLRARALSPYADCSKLDRVALNRLRESSLVVFSEQSEDLAAPAHDILEDWALLEWLDEEFAKKRSSTRDFLIEIGTHPALRRTYRKWLEEMLEYASEEADKLVVSVLQSPDLPQQSRDDTLAAVLLSGSAEDFLKRNEPQLLGDDCSLLRRVIHLLRVGCKSSVGNVAAADFGQLIHYLPKYPAWAAVLKIVSKNLTALAPKNGELILGLLEDWAQGISWLLPYPPGASDAAIIAFELLPDSDDWRRWQREATKRLLMLIAKIPNANPKGTIDLAQRSIQGKQDHTANDFAELVLEHLDGIPMCRDFPEQVIQLAEARWGISPAKDKSEEWSESQDHFGVEVAFGLPRTLNFDYYPASAYHGPFRALLTHHPKLGVDFILRFSNYCAESYGNPNNFHRYVELPGKTSLTFSDGASKELWCNWRLWALYRGAHVGPHVLECALMALEHWLLQVCKTDPDQVEAWLMHLLKESNNVGIVAVTASVAIASPSLAGVAAPILLTSHEFIELDRARMVADYRPVGRYFEGLPENNPEHVIYENERKEADSLKHRCHDLEYLSIQLQTGKQRERVWKILDDYQTKLPSAERQTEEDKLWRLALLRMDLRKYEVKSELQDGSRLIGIKPPESDVQAVLDAHAPKQQSFDERVRLLNWGMGVFRREDASQTDPDKWRDQLIHSKTIYASLSGDVDSEDEIGWRMASAGPAYVAAVLVRDHWDELDQAERNWVVQVVTDSVRRDADSANDLFRGSKNAMDASRPTAFVLPALLNRGFPKESEHRVLETLALAMTHASEEVTDYAAEGIGAFLWKTDSSLARTCIRALVEAATLEIAILKRQGANRRNWRVTVESILEKGMERIRETVVARETLIDDQVLQLDLEEWPGQRALHYLLPIFSQAPGEQLSRNFFVKLAETLVVWWRRSLDDWEHGRERHYELEYSSRQRIAKFVLRLSVEEAQRICAPFADAEIDCPKEVADFVKQLIISEDAIASGTTFWTLWQIFADRVTKLPWATSVTGRDSAQIELVNALFLDVSWNPGVRSWQRLTGYESRLDRLFEDLPPTLPSLVAYARYLVNVGEKSLPNAIVLISKKIRQSSAKPLRLNSNAQYYLETILRQWVLSQPGKLKENADLREAALHVLDELVEAGSSVAYRLRDDFVTPVGSPP